MNSPYTIPVPKLGNQFLEDTALLDYLDYFLPKDIIEAALPDLTTLGEKVITEALPLAQDAERNPPTLEQFDAWGNRVDRLHTTQGWKSLKDFSAKYGIVAFGYENKYGDFTRLLQFIRLYLFGPSSGLFNCPLAMTDGAAYLIKNTLREKGQSLDPEVKKNLEHAFSCLTSRDPQKFWTSGQWMTEVRGGSDVSGASATYAVKDSEGQKRFKLYGDKWFSSATDANMAVTVARIVPNENVKFEDAKKTPLSLFFLHVRDESGNLNGIKIRKLKDKLGTRQLPTAELELRGTKALMASDEGKGIKAISDMLNVTRIYNAAAALGFMRRTMALVREYSKIRTAWGKPLKDLPLYSEVMFRMEIAFRGNLVFMLRMSRLFGLVEENKATKDQVNIFRIMVPVLKLFTAKEAMKITSEGIECFGGQGYIESSGLPVIARDAQVLTIWEGTTNVLSHDFIRGLGNNTEKLESLARLFRESIRKILESDSEIISSAGVRDAAHFVITSFNNLYADLYDVVTDPKKLPLYERNLRKICFSMGRLFVAVHLGLISLHTGLTRDIFIFVQWVNTEAPYTRYLASKTKFELDPNLSTQIANGQGSIRQAQYIRSQMKPKL